MNERVRQKRVGELKSERAQLRHVARESARGCSAVLGSSVDRAIAECALRAACAC